MKYFVSDVHLGLKRGNPAEREARFVSWLRAIPHESGNSLYLLGDIWDFWYEYHDVVPKRGARVIAALIDLMDSGVEVNFVPGNHDIWCYGFFAELGMKILPQGYVLEDGAHRVLVAHGDLLGGASRSYRFMQSVFHNRVCQRLFSALHPRIAFKIGCDWSKSSRKAHAPYQWKGLEEPLCKWSLAQEPGIDTFIFGHFHTSVDQALPEGKRLIVLDSWVDCDDCPCVISDGADLKVCR